MRQAARDSLGGNGEERLFARARGKAGSHGGSTISRCGGTSSCVKPDASASGEKLLSFAMTGSCWAGNPFMEFPGHRTSPARGKAATKTSQLKIFVKFILGSRAFRGRGFATGDFNGGRQSLTSQWTILPALPSTSQSPLSYVLRAWAQFAPIAQHDRTGGGRTASSLYRLPRSLRLRTLPKFSTASRDAAKLCFGGRVGSQPNSGLASRQGALWRLVGSRRGSRRVSSARRLDAGLAQGIIRSWARPPQTCLAGRMPLPLFARL